MVRIGVIGCGKVAQVRHLPEIAGLEDGKLYALYDLKRQRAEAMSELYGGTVYDSWQQMIDDPAIDAVFVLTANATHAEISSAALRAGKHVMCEKPMAVSLEQCEEMVEAAEKTGTYLMIGQNQRLSGAHVKAKELIDQGLIGKILTFQTTFGHSGADNWSIDGENSWFFDKEKAHFGVMADLGVHKTDLIHFLTGEYVTDVEAILTTLDKRDINGNLIEVDDNALCLYRLSEGTIGTMCASWTRYGIEDNSTVLYGTKGIMEIYKNPEHTIVIHKKDGETLYFDEEAIQTNDNQTDSGIARLFVDGIEGRKERAITGKSVIKAMKAIFAAEESNRTGKMVHIL